MQVWEVLLDWAVKSGNKSFFKSVNKSSRSKILKESVEFKNDIDSFIKFKGFILNINMNSLAYQKIKVLIVKGLRKNIYEELPKDWISRIFQLNLFELKLISLEWVEENLRVFSPLGLNSLEIVNTPITSANLAHLLSFLPFLTSLKLDNLRCVNDRLLEYFPSYIPNIKYLSLEGSSITNHGLFKAFDESGLGEDLGLLESKKGYVQFQSSGSEGLRFVEALNLSFCFSITDQGLGYLASSSCHFKDLKFKVI